MLKLYQETRSYHQFIPLSNTKLAVKTVSKENDYSFTFNFESNTMALQIKIAGFVSCIYDGQPWIGIVEEIASVNKDVKIKFLHPLYPSRAFHWPPRDDVCLVPETNILGNISTPATVTGRQYTLSNSDSLHINACWLNFNAAN